MEHIPQELKHAIGDTVAGRIGDMLLRMNQVRAVTGLSSASIYRQIKEGRFPTPVRVGDRASAWRLTDLERWIADLPEAF